ncbi:hypothetical protein D3C84_1091720 [compost metagenome]
MGCYEHDGDVIADFRELLLELHSVHAGHAHVQHQAPMLSWAPLLQELLSADEGLHLEPGRSQQISQPLPNRCIIVHDKNNGLRDQH